jgi:hypothetical protein
VVRPLAPSLRAQFLERWPVSVLAFLVFLVRVIEILKLRRTVILYPVDLNMMGRVKIEEDDMVGLDVFGATGLRYMLNLLIPVNK